MDNGVVVAVVGNVRAECDYPANSLNIQFYEYQALCFLLAKLHVKHQDWEQSQFIRVATYSDVTMKFDLQYVSCVDSNAKPLLPIPVSGSQDNAPKHAQNNHQLLNFDSGEFGMFMKNAFEHCGY